MSDNNGCGVKHFKLAAWIIGSLLAASVTVTLALTNGMSDRLRASEIKAAETAVQFNEIQKSLAELKSDIKELKRHP